MEKIPPCKGKEDRGGGCLYNNHHQCNPNQAYSYFFHTFSGIYDHAFLVKEIKRKRKTLLNPWMSKRLQKSSKKKQKLHNRFLKNRTDQNEKRHKD